jgi:DNA polymerase I
MGLRPHITPHNCDELVLEVPQAELHLVKEMLPKLIFAIAELQVPLLVELGEGKNWDEAH